MAFSDNSRADNEIAAFLMILIKTAAIIDRDTAKRIIADTDSITHA